MHVFGRGQSTTRQDLARAEFVESMDHFRQAATHAAGGLGATVGPRVGTGMDMARDRMGSARGYVISARGYVGPGTNKLTQAASRGWDSDADTLRRPMWMRCAPVSATWVGSKAAI